MPKIIKEDVVISHVAGERLVDAIKILQDALDALPAEYRDIATLEMDAYDWGDTYVEVIRQPNADEIAKSEKLIADRAALISMSSKSDIEEWVRNVRVVRHCSREDALALIDDGTEQVFGHPKYDGVTGTIIL